MTTRKLTWIGALLLGLSLGLLIGTVANAETNATEQPVATAASPATESETNAPKKHGIAITIGENGEATGIEMKGHDGVGMDLTKGKEIPKDVVEKLSGEQLYKLMQMKMDKSADIPMIAPLIVGIVFGMPVAIVAVVLIFRQRRNAMLHKTLAAMIDKGVPIPPELLTPAERRPKSDLRRGIVLVAAGIGLVVFFALQKDEVWGLGLIPLLIGVGYLIVWKLDPNRKVA